MNDVETRSSNMPPRWSLHTFGRMHRSLYRLSRGRFLWTTASKRGWCALHLTTVGQTSGKERMVIVGYLADGSNLVALAMNGWDEGVYEPRSSVMREGAGDAIGIRPQRLHEGTGGEGDG